MVLCVFLKQLSVPRKIPCWLPSVPGRRTFQWAVSFDIETFNLLKSDDVLQGTM